MSSSNNRDGDESIEEDIELSTLEALFNEPEQLTSKRSSDPISSTDRDNIADQAKPNLDIKEPSTSHAANTDKKSTTDAEDADLLALEAILSEPAADKTDNTGKSDDPSTTQLPKKPRLHEDSTFAEAFSYEIIDVPKKSSSVGNDADDVDSSDDEDIKNFLERKYNEYGRDINKRLKQQQNEKQENRMAREVEESIKKPVESQHLLKNPLTPKVRQALLSSSFQKVASPVIENSVVNRPIVSQPTQPTFTDPIFGLRIINPLISSTLLTERMAGRKSIPVAYIPIHIERGDLSKDWVFAGAVISKSTTQTTKKGQPYAIWKISDLRGEIKMVSLFLFAGAYKDLWKTAQGTCIAVLNPTVFEKRAKSDEIACLSIDTAQKVLILGQSKDLGTCKSKKRNGENCTAVVNLSECDHCIFHMKQEYGKLSRRSELQSTSGGINELRNKVLGKSEVFYGGQSYTAIPAKKSAKLTAKDSQRISTLSEYAVSPFLSSVNHVSQSKVVNKGVPYAKSDRPTSKIASNVETNAKQRLKDMERLSILMSENERHANKQEESPNCSKEQNSTNTPDKFKNREFSFMARTPKLSSENFCIEINIGEKRAQRAKQKAAQLLKNKPLEKPNPNSIRGTTTGKRRAIDELNEKFISQEAKRQRMEEEQRENDRKSRIQRIIDATSSHSNLIDLRELQEQDKYFSKLEKKEALEEKMLNTYKTPCKAVICQKCKYTAFSAADRCKEEKHPLKIIDSEKRFFKCKDCGNRTATLFKIPKTSCKNCQSSRWERTAMIRERKLCVGEKLSVRGDEETFLGSLAANANMSLLVPEE